MRLTSAKRYWTHGRPNYWFTPIFTCNPVPFSNHHFLITNLITKTISHFDCHLFPNLALGMLVLHATCPKRSLRTYKGIKKYRKTNDIEEGCSKWQLLGPLFRLALRRLLDVTTITSQLLSCHLQVVQVNEPFLQVVPLLVQHICTVLSVCSFDVSANCCSH